MPKIFLQSRRSIEIASFLLIALLTVTVTSKAENYEETVYFHGEITIISGSYSVQMLTYNKNDTLEIEIQVLEGPGLDVYVTNLENLDTLEECYFEETNFSLVSEVIQLGPPDNYYVTFQRIDYNNDTQLYLYICVVRSGTKPFPLDWQDGLYIGVGLSVLVIVIIVSKKLLNR